MVNKSENVGRERERKTERGSRSDGGSERERV